MPSRHKPTAATTAKAANCPKRDIGQSLGANKHIWSSGMTGRTTRRSVTFSQPFSLSDIDGIQPAGTYRVQTVDVSLEKNALPAYRRISTTIELPDVGAAGLRRRVMTVDALELEAALTKDKPVIAFPATLNAGERSV